MFVALGAVTVDACGCLPPITVQDEFARSEVVIIATLKGFKEVDRRMEGTALYRTNAAVMSIEKVYKGGLQEGEDIEVYDGGGGDCSSGFRHDRIGQKYLFYTNGPRKLQEIPGPLYWIGLCSRSRAIEDAAGDLVYLDQRGKLEGKTRLSGTIRASGENMTLPSMADLKISLVGPGFHRELETDANGFFDVWDAPPGAYTINYQVPAGWRVSGYSVSSATRPGWQKPSNSLISVSISPKKHTEVRTYIEIDNEISGKVLSPKGEPMKGVCVGAYWLTPTSDSFLIPHDCTNDKGEFSIAQLPPGKYRLEINSTGEISSSNPFETFYYPSADKKEDAEPVAVGAGSSAKNLVVHVKKLLPMIKISGRLTFQDGRPYPAEEVRFDPTNENRYERAEVETDKEGNFTFILPQGAAGKLSAEANIYEIRFEECAAVKELRKTHSGMASVFSNVVAIDGQSSRGDITLSFRLPYCKPGK